MASDMQNPGLAPRDSRNQLVGWLHPFPTPTQRQAQMLGCRFRLTPSMARVIARHCYGEQQYD